MISSISIPKPSQQYRAIGRETFPRPQSLFATGRNVGVGAGYADQLDAKTAATKLSEGPAGTVAMIGHDSRFFLQPVEVSPTTPPGLTGVAAQQPYHLEGRIGREPVKIALSDPSVLSLIDGPVALSQFARG